MVHCLNAVLIFPKILQSEQLMGLFTQDEKKIKSEERKENLLDENSYEKNKNFWWACDILRK
jgi:hypothetical protein